MTGYSTREAAALCGLDEAQVRSLVRAGFLAPNGRGVSLRFAFRDVLVLRLVRQLLESGVPLRRLRRQLRDIKSRLAGDRSLASLSIIARDGHVVIASEDGAYRPDTGQLVFDFAGTAPPGVVAELPLSREAPGPSPTMVLSAEDWFERAVNLEETDPVAAIAAYRRAQKLSPESPDIHINLGRLCAETGDLSGAERCFRDALAIDPGDATAVYNLGVIAQDAGNDSDAIDLYRRALALDPSLAEAHYNLATVYDRGGDMRAAIRHINEYRKLTRG